MALEHFLLQQGLVSWKHIDKALDRQRETRPRLGALAIEAGYLAPRQVDTILSWQQTRPEHAGLLFGEVAVLLGYLNASQIGRLLDLQATLTKTLSQVLVEIGALSEEARAHHLERFRHWLHAA